MNIKTLEWQLNQLTGVPVFDKETKEAVTAARNVIATLRAAFDISPDVNVDDVIKSIWLRVEASKETQP